MKRTGVSHNNEVCEAVLMNSVDAILIINAAGIIQEANLATEKITGFSPEELIGDNISGLMTDSDKNSHDHHLSRYHKTGQAKVIGNGRPVLVQHKTGRTITCDLAVSEITVKGNQFFAGTLRDISEKVRQEATIARQRDGLLILHRLSAENIENIDSGLNLAISMSLNYFELENGSICRVDGEDSSIIASNLNKHELQDLNRCLRNNGSSFHYIAEKKRLIAENNASREKYSDSQNAEIASIIGAPITVNGALWGVFCCSSPTSRARDFDNIERQIMTLLASWMGVFLERHRSLNLLMEKEERLRRSQIFANIGTWDWNITTGDLYWSERIAPLFGYAEGQLETTYENFLNAVHPDDRESVENAVNDCINHNKDYDIEHRVIWPDGTLRWLHESGDVVRDQNGRAVKMLGVVQDIDRMKRAESALTIAKEIAEKANKAKSDFLSSMSHELRTPMNSILGFGQLLESDRNLKETQQEYVGLILNSGNHLLQLIDGVLDLSRIEAGKLALSIIRLNANGLVKEVIALIQELANRKGISILYSDPDKQHFVYGDSTRFKQVLINFLSNAIKYNIEGGWISVSVKSTLDAKVRVTVSDSGKGIAKEMQSDVFTPFNRLGMETSAEEGTGIGLSLSRQLIENMNGNMDFSSEEGRGSCFWFELPIASMETAEEKSIELHYSTDKNTMILDKNHKILYVEDDTSNISLMKAIINEISPCQLLIATDAESGLNIAFNERPDLILMDINLPGMNGVEALDCIRKDNALSATPVIAVSADATQDSLLRAQQAGFNDYVTKPIDIPYMLNTINGILNENGQ